MRAVMNAQLYLLRTGCQWRMLPKDFPRHPTVYGYFQEFVQLRIWDDIHAVLLKMLRERMQRNRRALGCHHRQPERQERRKRGRGFDAIGFDAAKKIKGVKRHIATDTQGLLLNAIVHPANVQDRDGAVDLLKGLKKLFPGLKHVWADSAYMPTSSRSLQSHGDWKARDRKALRHGERLPGAATALGGGAHPRLDGPQPPPRQALRGPRRDRPRIPQARHDPTHAAPAWCASGKIMET